MYIYCSCCGRLIKELQVHLCRKRCKSGGLQSAMCLRSHTMQAIRTASGPVRAGWHWKKEGGTPPPTPGIRHLPCKQH
eukprot:1158545-Pelagomonas_calceolata.AAC.7